MARRTVLLAVVLSVVLAGCAFGGGGAGGGGDGGGAADAGAAGGGDAAASGGDAAEDAAEPQEMDGSGGGATTRPLQADRAIVRTGSMTVRVDSFGESRAALVEEVRAVGGYVGGGDQRLHRDGNRSWRTGTLVLRVPSSSFERVRRVAAEQGVVVEESSETEDVTDRLVDLEARLTNLRAQRDRVRTLYERANGTDELLRVGERLTEIQERIERLEAERRALEQQVSLSTLRVTLREQPPDPSGDPEEPDGLATAAAAAFSGSVATLVGVGRGAVVALAGLVPYLAALGTLAGGLGLVGRVAGRGPLARTGEGSDGDDPGGAGDGEDR